MWLDQDQSLGLRSSKYIIVIGYVPWKPFKTILNHLKPKPFEQWLLNICWLISSGILQDRGHHHAGWKRLHVSRPPSSMNPQWVSSCSWRRRHGAWHGHGQSWPHGGMGEGMWRVRGNPKFWIECKAGNGTPGNDHLNIISTSLGFGIWFLYISIFFGGDLFFWLSGHPRSIRGAM